MENTQPRFTPGPWAVDRNEIHAPSTGRIVCMVGWLMPTMQGDTAEANASLIACAPEMYALLCNILNDLEIDGYISLEDNAATDIRGLLAKARGDATNGD